MQYCSDDQMVRGIILFSQGSGLECVLQFCNALTISLMTFLLKEILNLAYRVHKNHPICVLRFDKPTTEHNY